MAQALFKLLSGVAGERPLGTVLVLGAGDGSALPAWAALGARRLILVEGDPEAAQSLRDRAAGQPAVEVVERCVVADGHEPLTWHRYSLPGLNGPRRWPELQHHYPGLRQLDELSMRTENVAALVRELDIAMLPGHDNLLALDLPGQELALLQGWPGHERSRWRWILVRGCSLGPAPASATVDWLVHKGAQAAGEDTQDQPLWPVHLLRQAPGGAAVERPAGVAQADLATPVAVQAPAPPASLAPRTSESDTVAELRAELASARRRMQLLEQELVRAEAQIGLLKDLLLREPGL